MPRQPSRKRNQSVSPRSDARHRTKSQNLVVQQPLPLLNTRLSPKQLFNAMVRFSARQKEAVKNMGLGGMLGFNVNGIPEKLAFHIVDQFDADSMTLNLGSSKLVVDGGLISKLLGIRDEVWCFSDVEPTKTLHPSLKVWRAKYPPTSYIAPSLVSSEIQRDKYADMAHFRTDFSVLFLTTMVSSQHNGYVRTRS
ncbi:hypothetical protein HanLR1_Chr16g0613071 [Helianthus annuus]|nr:hypothetical protein HanLR1_Chr16g0613071 [Helianthus annuus]